MPKSQKSQITLRAALSQFNLTAEFKARADARQTDKQLGTWLRTQIGDKASVSYPASYYPIRKELGCQRKHGGWHGNKHARPGLREYLPVQTEIQTIP